MAGGITKIYDSLKNEFNKAENELKSVDKDLKKLIGGDVFEKSSANSRKNDTSNRTRTGQSRTYFDDKKYSSSSRTTEMSRKRRLSDSSSSRIFSRLDKRLDDDRVSKRPSLQSTIVTTTPVSIKLKQENTVDLQKDKELDKKNTARNRRMFGMINMTLQKFQNEESQRKTVTTKREEIEKKLDLAVAEEKQAVEQEKLSLIKSKRVKQTELKNIELKMDRVEIHQQWEKSNQHLANFIQTKTKPHIFYMPNKLTPDTEKRLKETKDKYLIILAEKRAKIQKEIEDLTKKDEELRKENLNLSSVIVIKPEKEDKLKNGDIKLKNQLIEKKGLNNVKNDIEEGECNSNEADSNKDNSEEELTNDKKKPEDRKELDDKDLKKDSIKKDKSEKENIQMEESNLSNNLMKEDVNTKSSNELTNNQLTDGLINLNEESNNLNDELNDNLNQNDESLKDENSQQVIQSNETKLEDKEFEPIYDE